MSMEDLFADGGATVGFENLDIRQTIEGMRRHQSHNGVQLDAIKHLLTFASNGMKRFFFFLFFSFAKQVIISFIFKRLEYNADLIIENDGLTAVIQALQAFSVDEKLVSIAFCLVGTLFLAASGFRRFIFCALYQLLSFLLTPFTPKI